MNPILRRKEVEQATRLSKATLYRMVKAGTFPKPVKLGERAVGWRGADVAGWIEGRPPVGGQSNDTSQ